MSQVQFENTEHLSIKKVWFEGIDTLRSGYLLCYNADYGVAADVDASRAYKAEKPADANVDNFAGVVSEKYDGKVGPCAVEIYVPVARGQKVPIWTDASVTVEATDLYLQPGSFAAGHSGARRIGKAMQTVARTLAAPGTCLARLDGPDSLRADDQEIGSSAHFTDAIWKNFPLAELRRNPHIGTLVEYDPSHNPKPLPPYASFDDANAAIEQTARPTLAEGLQLILAQGAAAENNAAEIQIPGKIDLDGKPWALEVEYDLVVVGDDDVATFVGLWNADTLDGDLMADATQVLDDQNFLGFEVKHDDGNAIDTVYRKDGAAQQDHQAGAGVPTANTAIRVAMYYDGATIAVYVDGVAVDEITAANIAAVTFPADADVYLTFISKGGASAADGDDLNIRNFRVAQLA